MGLSQTAQDFLELHRNPSCTNYRIWKSDLAVDSPILSLNRIHAITMFKFRCVNLSFQGRTHFCSNATSKECHLCKDQIGHDFHLLLECPELRSLRRKFIPDEYSRHPNSLKFQQLMSTTYTKTLLIPVRNFLSNIKSCN